MLWKNEKNSGIINVFSRLFFFWNFSIKAYTCYMKKFDNFLKCGVFFSDFILLCALLPLEVSSFCASTSITRALMHTWVVKVARHSKPNIPRALLMGKELTIVIPNIEDIILKMARKFKRLLVLFKVKKSLGIIRKTQVSGFGSAMKVELTSTYFWMILVPNTYLKI